METFIPMPEGFKRLIDVVAIICAVVWVLQAFGLIHSLPFGMHVPSFSGR